MIKKIKIHEDYRKRIPKKEYEFDKRLNLLYGCNGIGKSSLLELIANNRHATIRSKNIYEPISYYKDYMDCEPPKIAFYRVSVDSYKRANNYQNDSILNSIENVKDYWFAINSSEGQAIAELFLDWLNKLDDDIDILLIDELDSGLSVVSIYMCAHYINEWLNKHRNVQCFISINNYEWVRLFKKIYRIDNGQYQEIKNYEEFFEITKDIHIKLYDNGDKNV